MRLEGKWALSHLKAFKELLKCNQSFAVITLIFFFLRSDRNLKAGGLMANKHKPKQKGLCRNIFSSPSNSIVSRLCQEIRLESTYDINKNAVYSHS